LFDNYNNCANENIHTGLNHEAFNYQRMPNCSLLCVLTTRFNISAITALHRLLHEMQKFSQFSQHV